LRVAAPSRRTSTEAKRRPQPRPDIGAFACRRPAEFTPTPIRILRQAVTCKDIETLYQTAARIHLRKLQAKALARGQYSHEEVWAAADCRPACELRRLARSMPTPALLLACLGAMPSLQSWASSPAMQRRCRPGTEQAKSPDGWTDTARQEKSERQPAPPLVGHRIDREEKRQRYAENTREGKPGANMAESCSIMMVVDSADAELDAGHKQSSGRGQERQDSRMPWLAGGITCHERDDRGKAEGGEDRGYQPGYAFASIILLLLARVSR
jgi:hypothetical protein